MNILLTGIRIRKPAFLTNLVLQFAFTSLYYVSSTSLLDRFITSSDESSQLAFGTFHFVIVTTLIICMFCLQNISKVKNIYMCSISLLLTFITILFFPEGPFGLVLVFIGGAFFAMGQLLSFTYFWSSTVPEERGRIAGFIGFLVLPLAFITRVLAGSLDLFGVVMLLVVLILGILATHFLKPEEITRKQNEEPSGSYYERRTILLYAIPWIIFCIINSTLDRNISLNILQGVPESLPISPVLVQLVGIAFGALGGGFVADLFGRKLSLSSSLTLYGISTALGGFAQNTEVAYFVYLVNGLTWGILWSMYGSVVWGDLANGKDCVKRYASGLVIFYFPICLVMLFSTQISQISVVWSALLGCSAIFLSNLPLFLAPELLSESFRDKIRLRLHMSAVKKLDKESRSHG